MQYKDIMLYYHLEMNMKEVDHHFSDIFAYAKTEGKELSMIEPKDVSKLEKGDEPEVVKVVLTQVDSETPAQP